MSFSFRTMFRNSHEAGQQAGSAVMDPAGTSPADLPSAIMQAALPLNAVSPFGGPLFKASPGEQAVASPVAGSPFSVSSAGPANVPLTVGDVIPQLPPELARAGALPPEHPVALSGQVIDEALRSGRAAVPVFEIYRVCPALFQTPVSPQDQRMVPLPAAKLPHLIAASRGGVAEVPASVPPTTVKASPFMMAAMPSEPAAVSPAAMSAAFTEAPAGTGTLLPPKRQGPPPALADVGKMVSPDVALPGAVHGTAAAFPMSPFAVGAGASPSVQAVSPASPFAVSPAEPAAVQPQRSAEQVASPFQTAPVPASPFAAASPSRQEVPPPQVADSPFAAVFGGKAVPVSLPTMEAQPSADPGLPSFGTTAPVPSPAMGGGMVRIAMAALLKGYTVAELGFDPIVVPGWITTALPSHVVRDLALSPTPLAELGLLVDGITDVGFRNVLNTAKRDFQMRVDPGVLQQALAGNHPPASLPSLTNIGTGSLPAAAKPAPSFGAPPGGPMRIEPSAPPTSFTPPQPSMPLTPAASASAPASQAAEAEAAPSPFLVPSTASKPLFAPAAAKDPFSVPGAAATSAFGGAMGMPPAARQQDFMAISPPPLEAPVAAQVPPLLTPAPGASFLDGDGDGDPHQPSGSGFGSDQLLGRVSSQAASWNEAAVASAMGESPVFPPAKEAPLIELPPAMPFLDEPAEPERAWAASPATRPFSPPKFDDSLPPVPVEEEPLSPPRKPSPPPLPRASASGSPSNVGVKAHDADPDQIVLRALLDTDSDLEPQKVVELTCRLPGIAACVCLHDGRAISHVGAHKPQAREFQRQATQLAQHLKTLAPLIGIDGAETFTMNSGDRLMTFCFPDRAIMGVLHDAEPTLGLRDKITLIARELSRMVS